VLSVVGSIGAYFGILALGGPQREVLERLQGTRTLVSNADAMQHSLLLQYDAQDQADFRASLAGIEREMAALQTLTRDNPVQQRALVEYRGRLDAFTRARFRLALPRPRSRPCVRCPS
jgi:hypothetical protein